VGRDGYTGLAVLAASLALFWATLGLERHPMVPVGPGFYPRIVLGLTALMALALVVFDAWGRSRARLRGYDQALAPAGAGAPSPNYLLVLIAFAVFTLYVVSLPYLGFRLATLLFLIAMPLVLERPTSRRRWIVMVILAIVATLVAHALFERYLQVLLPRGLWTSF
jgi:putative tricarboxylic transport membrane protein